MRIINDRIEAAEDINKLTPHPDNPRNGDVDAIDSSVSANGFYGVVVAQLSTGRILVGNHRYHVAMEQGASTIPVAWLDIDDQKALDILLSDNRTSDKAKNDDGLLASLLQQISDERGLEGTGYDDAFLDKLLSKHDEGGIDPIKEQYQILIECKNEKTQGVLLKELIDRGLKCQSLVS